MPFDQNRPAPGTPRYGNTPPSVDRLPSPPPFNPPPSPPQENPFPGGMGMEGVPLPPDPMFDQGDGTYGPSPDPFSTGPLQPPVGGPQPLPMPSPPNTDNPFAQDYNPLPQSHDRYGPNYVPELPAPPSAGSAGLTPEQIMSQEEARNWIPTGRPPSAMQPNPFGPAQ